VKRDRLLRLILASMVALGAAWVVLVRHQLDASEFVTIVDSLGSWAPMAFVAAFATGTVLLVPGSLFGLAGGVLFGPLWGTICNLLGGTVGAAMAFLIARYVAGDWISKKLGGRLKRVVESAEGEGWRFVALMRLIPVVPFNLLNYALGLTRIRFADFVIATLVCMVPGTAAYAWLGHAGRAAMAGDNDALRYGLIGLSVLAAIAFLPRFIRRLRAPSEHGLHAATSRATLRLTNLC
jgi:uncharacterized membrane protein YdjX (TVP38/TMEM64 family)